MKGCVRRPLEYQTATCFSQAINLLPANVQIREIQVFLESVLEEKAQRKRCNQVVKSLLQAEFLRVSSAQIPRGLHRHRWRMKSFLVRPYVLKMNIFIFRWNFLMASAAISGLSF